MRLDQVMRCQHPTLWRANVIQLAMFLVAGYGYLFTQTPAAFSTVPVRPVGAALIGAGLWLWWGWRHDSTQYARALGFGGGVVAFLAVSVAGSIIDGWANGGVYPSLGTFAFLAAAAAHLFNQASEEITRGQG